MNPDPEEITKLIMSAREALQRGDTDTVKRLAQQAASIDPESEVAWLLLALVASPEDSLAFVHEALKIDPDSEPARQALAWAQNRLLKQPAEAPHPVVLETPELDAETESPAEQPGIFNEVYQPLDELSAVMETQPEQPDEIFQDLAEEPELDVESWSFKTQSAPTAEKMEPALHTENLTDSHRPADGAGKKTRLSPVLILLFSALAVLIIAMLAGLTFLRPQLTSLWAGIFPGDPCQASLMIGTRSFQVQTLKPGSDGSYNLPGKNPEQAYWVEGSDSNTVFMLSPAAENLALMAGLQPGAPISFTRPDCNRTSYSMTLAVPADLDLPALLDQSRTGLTIIIPLQGSSSGYVLLGELQEQVITSFSTPDASEFQAEISLLETIPSADGRHAFHQ